MKLKTWTKGILTLFALLFLSTWAFQLDAWARVGGGGSSGSRGSRSMSAPTPARPTAPSSTYNPTRPSTPPPGATAPQPDPVLGRLHAQPRRRPPGRPGRRHALS